MSILGYILLFTFISGILSMVGGVVLLGNVRWVKKFSIHFISFAVGALLGAAFLDLLPEAIEHGEGESKLYFAIALGGIILFFLIERIIHQFHVHRYANEQEARAHSTPILLLVGDGVHNFVDGVIVASAFLIDIRLGVATALAVAAHELPQEISDFSIMLHHNWSRLKVFLANLGVSLTAIIGALLVYWSRDFLEPFLPGIIALSAGIFIYIATSDLLPEISPHTAKDKPLHVLTLVLLGIFAIWGIGQLVSVH